MFRKQLLVKTLERMSEVDSPNQILGRSHTIGCVAVEITQRCNLDCTLCYLSEHSQSVRDLPLTEVYRRLDAVVNHYGKRTNVQITGGDPTLRKHSQLLQIVRYAARIGLYPALFTNGIAATRPLLEKLARAGLRDIAFHVDTTQRRKGYKSEEELNTLRQEYINRTRGLGLMVIFNTTVHAGNFNELPMLVEFFRDNADVVGLVSFNLQAETGRGKWGRRQVLISQDSVKAQIETVASKALPWDAIRVGHWDCHSTVPTIVVNGRIHAVVNDAELVGQFLQDFPSISAKRYRNRMALVCSIMWAVFKNPHWWSRALNYMRGQWRQLGPDLLHSWGQFHKLTFFVQNFMDAAHLDRNRIHACSFMVMSADGPVSMCEHNARRDDYILQPIDIIHADGRTEHYEPLVRGSHHNKRGESK